MITAPTRPLTRAPRSVPAVELRARRAWGNRLFRGLTTTAAGVIGVVLAGVAGFLLVRAWPALTAPSTALSGTTGGVSLTQYVAPLLFGTVLAAMIGLMIALPMSTGIALFITHYAPRRLANSLGYLIDLLAAIPSVVFGLWAMGFLQPLLTPVFETLSTHHGFLPFFANYQAPARNILAAGIVLAIMILPIITATMREVFLQTPVLQQEAALALGATKWEMIRSTVLPFGRSGMMSAAMLGLGRALGETMAVLMVLSPGVAINFHLLQPGQHNTIAANIAAHFPESSGMAVSVLIATGLLLFALTLIVNIVARRIVKPGRPA